MTDAYALNFTRLFFAGATECELDKQGRILIPNSLREYAGINSDAMLVGMGSRIEIWGAEKWEEQLERMDNAGEESMAESLNYLAGLGI